MHFSRMEFSVLVLVNDKGEVIEVLSIPSTVHRSQFHSETHRAPPDLSAAHSVYGEPFSQRRGGDDVQGEWKFQHNFVGSSGELRTNC